MDQEVAKTLGELELKLQELERELTTIGHRDAPSAQGQAQSSQSQHSSHSQPQRPQQPSRPGRLVDEAVEQSAAEQALAEGDGFGGPPVWGGEEVPSQAGATVERDWTVEARETAYGEIPTPPASPTPGSQIPGPPPPGTPIPGPPGPPIPPPGPTPQPPPVTPPGPPPPETPPGPPPPETPPGPPPPSTPPGMQGPAGQPGMGEVSSSRGSHLRSPYDLDPRQPAAVEESRAVDLAELVRFRDKLASTMEALIEEYSRLVSVEEPEPPRGAGRSREPERPREPEPPREPGRPRTDT